MTTIRVNKIEAARRQIDATIRMLFLNEDPVAIHTLAMASLRILRDLAAKRDDCHFDRMIKLMIKPGMEGKFWGKSNQSANFLKHADRDPDEILDKIEEEVNEVILFLSCLYYQDLGFKLTPEMIVLTSWCLTLNPDFLQDNAPDNLKQLLNTKLSYLREKPRNEQLEIGRQLIHLARNQIGQY
jgi:hypothetical protein